MGCIASEDLRSSTREVQGPWSSRVSMLAITRGGFVGSFGLLGVQGWGESIVICTSVMAVP
jgi:hypothetical protein